MMHGALKALRAHVHHLSTLPPGPWSSRAERSLIKQREELYRCCSLIYKRSPILRMVGASARYSCLRAPVETVTPPRQPNTIRSCGRACAAALTDDVRLPLRLEPVTLGFESVKNERNGLPRQCSHWQARIASHASRASRWLAMTRRRIYSLTGSGYSEPKVSTVTFFMTWGIRGLSL